MIALPTEMIVASVIFFVTFGVFSGMLYSMIRLAFFKANQLILKIRKKASSGDKSHDLLLNFFDGLYVFAVGLIYVIASYVLVDGVFEINSVIILFVGMLVGKGIFDFILRKLTKTSH